MKILYVVPSVQHPTMRGALRHYEFLLALARRHEMTLLALTRTEVTPEARRDLAAATQRLEIVTMDGHASPATRHRGILARIARRAELGTTVGRMRELFSKLVREEAFDVVLFHGKDVQPVIEALHDVPLVVDFCDATSMRERQRLRRAKVLNLPWRFWRYAAARRVEKKLVAQTSHLAFISARDRDAVMGPDSGATVIPNGIDLSYWTRRPELGDAPGNRLVFTGVMDYAPNADAALCLIERILPLLRPRLPGLELLVVGRDPTPALVAAGRRNPEVTVTGFVPDVRPYLERATVYVAPIRYASGLQNKILEALAMEVPVITSSVVAAGVRVAGAAGPPLETAESAADFVAAIVSLSRDDAERSRRADAGRRYVEDHFDWTRSATLLEALCMQAAALPDIRQGRTAREVVETLAVTNR